MSDNINEQQIRVLKEVKANQRSVRRRLILNTRVKISDYLVGDTAAILESVGKRKKSQLAYLQCIMSILEIQDRINRTKRIRKKAQDYAAIDERIKEYESVKAKLLKDLKKRHKEQGFGKLSVTNLRRKINQPESLQKINKEIETAFLQEGKIISLNDI